MDDVHNQRLEIIVGNMVETANAYFLEQNLPDCMVITQSAAELYHKFDQKYNLSNDNLKYRLALAYSKLATLQTLEELQKEGTAPKYLQQSYDRKLSAKISSFCSSVGINFTVLTFINFNLEPTDRVIAGLKRMAPSLSSDLLKQYEDCFDYINVLKTHFGTFCGQRDLTDAEKDILERFKPKYGQHHVNILSASESKRLPERC